jgi:hypothetical protein
MAKDKSWYLSDPRDPPHLPGNLCRTRDTRDKPKNKIYLPVLLRYSSFVVLDNRYPGARI